MNLSPSNLLQCILIHLIVSCHVIISLHRTTTMYCIGQHCIVLHHGVWMRCFAMHCNAWKGCIVLYSTGGSSPLSSATRESSLAQAKPDERQNYCRFNHKKFNHWRQYCILTSFWVIITCPSATWWAAKSYQIQSWTFIFWHQKPPLHPTYWWGYCNHICDTILMTLQTRLLSKHDIECITVLADRLALMPLKALYCIQKTFTFTHRIVYNTHKTALLLEVSKFCCGLLLPAPDSIILSCPSHTAFSNPLLLLCQNSLDKALKLNHIV